MAIHRIFKNSSPAFSFAIDPRYVRSFSIVNSQDMQRRGDTINIAIVYKNQRDLSPPHQISVAGTVSDYRSEVATVFSGFELSDTRESMFFFDFNDLVAGSRQEDSLILTFPDPSAVGSFIEYSVINNQVAILFSRFLASNSKDATSTGNLRA